jgi:arylsulfatase A
MIKPSRMIEPSEISRRTVLQTIGAAALGARILDAAPSKTPNVVLIFCDDLGYGDLGPYGSKIPTPNIDRLAADGIRFTNMCSADPVCSPSRAALLTGRYPTRVGVPRVFFPQDKDGLNLEERTLANVLKDKGYRTACVGKWHLGRPVEYLPTSRGFDQYFGIPYSNDMTPRVLLRNTEVVEEPAKLETLTARYTEVATKFVRESKGSPFFLYMPHTFPHIPLAASARFRGKSPQGLYGDVIEELDWSIGEVLRALKEEGLENDTLVMLSSDNGPWYQGSPGRLRGRKGSTYEGGIREPFIARWSGRIPRGKTTPALASLMDVFPTVTKLCNGKLPAAPLDGVDLWPLLMGGQESAERPPLLYFNDWNLQCARWKNWKLHVARHNTAAYTPAPPGGIHNFELTRPELYDLDNDPDESYDVAPDRPEIVSKIQARIAEAMGTFPEPVQKAYADSKARQTSPTMPTGSWARPVR